MILMLVSEYYEIPNNEYNLIGKTTPHHNQIVMCLTNPCTMASSSQCAQHAYSRLEFHICVRDAL